MVNIAMFLASEKGYNSLRTAIDRGLGSRIKFVSTFKETNVSKSYDEDIKSLCKEYHIRHFEWSDLKGKLHSVIQEMKVDIAFTVSWKFIIDTRINELMRYGLVVFHDSLLPKYRGFAPTPTAIMCGEKKVGVTALFAAIGIDEGDIILQKEIAVDDNEYISDIISKEALVCADMIVEITDLAEKNALSAVKQDNSNATYSIWRNPEDCRIDWNDSSENIRNMIRAVSSPYPGAYCFYKGKKIIIDKAELIDDLPFSIRQPGKLWQISDNCPHVICGKGMIKILCAHYEDGTEVVFDRLRINLSLEVIS